MPPRAERVLEDIPQLGSVYSLLHPSNCFRMAFLLRLVQLLSCFSEHLLFVVPSFVSGKNAIKSQVPCPTTSP